MCDLDLAWGDIRKFITDDLLNKYERIGFLGHSTIYKNTTEVNSRYRTIFDGNNYKVAYTNQGSYAFDEVGMDNIYKILNIPYYDEIIFANLEKYSYGFSLDLMPKEDDFKNEYQIFTLEDGKIYRYYLHNKKIEKEEYFYIHFWCRPMTYRPKVYDKNKKYIIYPDVVDYLKEDITPKLIHKRGKGNLIMYYTKSIWKNRKKLTLERIIFNIKGMLKYKQK